MTNMMIVVIKTLTKLLTSNFEEILLVSGCWLEMWYNSSICDGCCRMLRKNNYYSVSLAPTIISNKNVKPYYKCPKQPEFHHAVAVNIFMYMHASCAV